MFEVVTTLILGLLMLIFCRYKKRIHELWAPKFDTVLISDFDDAISDVACSVSPKSYKLDANIHVAEACTRATPIDYTMTQSNDELGDAPKRSLPIRSTTTVFITDASAVTRPVSFVELARQPRGPNGAGGFDARANLCTGIQNRCDCTICKSSLPPTPPPSPKQQHRCPPAVPKRHQRSGGRRFARLKLCKWEQGEFAAEGCWQHIKCPGSCKDVHRDQPELLAKLKQLQSRSIALGSSSVNNRKQLKPGLTQTATLGLSYSQVAAKPASSQEPQSVTTPAGLSSSKTHSKKNKIRTKHQLTCDVSVSSFGSCSNPSQLRNSNLCSRSNGKIQAGS